MYTVQMQCTGTANPDVGMGGLTDEVSFGNFYVPDGDKVFLTDLVDGAVKLVKTNVFDADYIKQNIDKLFPDVAARASLGSVAGRLMAELYGKLDSDNDLKPQGNRYNNTNAFDATEFVARTAGEENDAGGTAKSKTREIKAFVAKYCQSKGDSTPNGREYVLLSQLIFSDKDNVDLPGLLATITGDYDAKKTAIAAALVKVHARESEATGRTVVVIRPRVVAVMSSAILAAPGEDTGSLLVGYPFVSILRGATCLDEVASCWTCKKTYYCNVAVFECIALCRPPSARARRKWYVQCMLVGQCIEEFVICIVYTKLA